MSNFAAISPLLEELIAVRRDLHAHPEIGLDVPRTAGIVARHLQASGIEVATGIGGHGVVGTIRGNDGPGPTIGLRADMDALPIHEPAGAPWRSLHEGRMHACGHDGHTAMLLGAARHLAATRAFRGTARVIFQPGEEGAGGALAMLTDGLFERFPCDAIYGLHNRPGLALGTFAIAPGAFMAGGAFFDVAVDGVGAHGGTPETGVDAILVAAQIIGAAQGIVARTISAFEPAVLSITRVAGGNAYNVMPAAMTLGGTARWLRPETLPKLERGFGRLIEHVAASFGTTARLDWRVVFDPLVNDGVHAARMADAAATLVGEDKVVRNAPPVMVSEDFSFMLGRVPGAYIQIGIGDAADLHNPAYAFNDAAIPFGSAFLASLLTAPTHRHPSFR